MANLVKGVDISVIQGNVNFTALKNDGIEFVICRCSVGNEGKDTDYDKNITNAIAAGLKVAAYHFVYPLPPLASQPLRDPVKQAQLHAGWAGSITTVPVICCDFEWPAVQDWAKWGCTAPQLIQWITTYLQAYEQATGVRPIVYTYPYFAQALNLPQSFADTYKLWIASYQPTPQVPKPWDSWVLWQDSSGPYHLPGTNVVVDTDKARDLSLWDVVAVAPPPAPVPVSEPVVAPVTPPSPPVNVSPSTTLPTVYRPNVFILLYNMLVALYNKFFKK